MEVRALLSAILVLAVVNMHNDVFKSNQIKFIRYTRSQNTNRKLENKDIKEHKNMRQTV